MSKLKLNKNNDIALRIEGVSEKMRNRCKYYFEEDWTLAKRSTKDKVVFECVSSRGDTIATIEDGKATSLITV